MAPRVAFGIEVELAECFVVDLVLDFAVVEIVVEIHTASLLSLCFSAFIKCSYPPGLSARNKACANAFAALLSTASCSCGVAGGFKIIQFLIFDFVLGNGAPPSGGQTVDLVLVA